MFKPAEPRELHLDHVGGLEIETDPRRRPPDSWNVLDNFDQFVSGAIRKVRGFHVLNDLPAYPQPIVAIRNFRRVPTDPLRIIGMDAHGVLYNLETGTALVDTAPTIPPPGGPIYRRPWLGQMAGLDNGASHPTTPSTPEAANFLVTSGAVEDQQPVKTDLLTSSDLGISAPADPPELLFLLITADGVTGNADPPLVSWSYVWTYWEPTTRHESSPSPLGATVQPGNALYPQAGDLGNVSTPNVKLQQVRVQIPTTAPAIGNTPTLRKRVYRTRDGGQTFFLLTGLFGMDADGAIPLLQTEIMDGEEVQNREYFLLGVQTAPIGPFAPPTNNRVVYDISPVNPNENVRSVYPSPPSGFSVLPIWTILQGFGAQLLQVSGLSPVPVGVPPITDAALVDPAPNPGDNDPPPPAAWGTTYQGRIFLLDQKARNRLLYSEAADSSGGPGFESFAPTNFFNLNASQDDPVTALDGQYQQLVIGKLNSTDRLVGTDFTDFVITPLDPQIGIVGRACLANSEGALFVLAQQYVIAWQGDVPSPYGRAVRPYTDAIDPAARFDRIVACIDTIQGMGIMSLVTPDETSETGFRYDLLIFDLSQTMPFSRVTGIPFEVTALSEVRMPNDSTVPDGPKKDDRVVLMGLADGRVYALWFGDFQAGELPIVATAETQPLPQDDPDTRKVFRELLVQLENYDGWEYNYGVDELPPTPFIPLQANNPIGVSGKQITITFRHNDTVPANERRVLPSYTVTYVMTGEAR